MATAAEKMKEAATHIEANQEAAKTVGAVYKFVLSGDGGGTWVLNLKDNPGVTEGDGDAQCTIKMAASDYVDMIEGKANGQQLFFGGKLKIEGDMGLAMKLQKLTEILK
ncbi:MAG: SCP2 sterol-binding domain-containing protein [Sorangiineae bacterium]|nr:SCP2 sterol-binding domain-containing protein [Polyangiaceae bacterium]MEB2324810.1 SCP2 sterol-binding domain-containing protein [Sorangiineae bacterium]